MEKTIQLKLNNKHTNIKDTWFNFEYSKELEDSLRKEYYFVKSITLYCNKEITSNDVLAIFNKDYFYMLFSFQHRNDIYLNSMMILNKYEYYNNVIKLYVCPYILEDVPIKESIIGKILNNNLVMSISTTTNCVNFNINKIDVDLDKCNNILVEYENSPSDYICGQKPHITEKNIMFYENTSMDDFIIFMKQVYNFTNKDIEEFCKSDDLFIFIPWNEKIDSYYTNKKKLKIYSTPVKYK